MIFFNSFLQVLRKDVIPVLVYIFLRLISLLSTYVCKQKAGKKREIEFPQIKDNILTIPAVDLAEKIRNKELSSEKVVQAYISRVQEVNPFINAVVDERFFSAILEAKSADEIVATKSKEFIKDKYPLLGVPFTVKEACSVKGLSGYTGMSLVRKDLKASEDGEVVANLRLAGAIPLLVSNTPEYCCAIETTNKIIGRTSNPYDDRRSCGGSSGGEGALNGAGATVFGVGSDLGGSIRIPSMCNGCFGHKPTPGVNSIQGHFPFSTNALCNECVVVGPICRYAKDLPFLMKIMSGSNASKLNLEKKVELKNIKIFYKYELKYFLSDVTPVAIVVKNSVLKTVNYLKSLNLATEEPEIVNMKHIFNIGDLIFDESVLLDPISHQEGSKNFISVCIEVIKAAFGKSIYSFAGAFFHFMLVVKGHTSNENILLYEKMRTDMKLELIKMLGDNGVLILPTNPNIALHHSDSYSKWFSVMYTEIFNLLGFPATNVPIGLNEDGLPMCVQVVAAPYNDNLCFTIANELEKAFGGWKAAR